jgi:hypothetical protein
MVHFVLIWYIFYGFGIMYQEKSGNPNTDPWDQLFKRIFKPTEKFSPRKHWRQNLHLENIYT